MLLFHSPQRFAFFTVLFWLALDPLAANSVLGQSQAEDVPSATEIRVLDPGWWPTKGSGKREEYVGSAACQACHREISESQPNTPMAHALTQAGPSAFDELSTGALHFSIGPYQYELARTPEGAVFSVTDGSQSTSAPVAWIFGNGQFGQTYILQQGGSFFESRLSYYRQIHGLDFTTGNPRAVPGSLATALGRRLLSHELPLCFGCHSTRASADGHFDPAHLVAGVSCEACHGPGAQHVAAMNLAQGASSSTFIMNPARLGPVASVDYCGACHRTAVDVSLMKLSGILTLRFPAYRLERSRCWGTGDARLTCSRCHDPHQSLVRDPGAYDRNCLACHAGKMGSEVAHRPQVGMARARNGRVCPVAQKNCVSCHMPQYTIPEMHTTFTDHKIAIHRAGAPFTE